MLSKNYISGTNLPILTLSVLWRHILTCFVCVCVCVLRTVQNDTKRTLVPDT